MPISILTKPRALAHLAALFVGLGFITYAIVKMWLWLFAVFYALSFIFALLSLVANRRADAVKLDMIGYMEAVLGMLPLIIAVVLIVLIKVAM